MIKTTKATEKQIALLKFVETVGSATSLEMKAAHHNGNTFHGAVSKGFLAEDTSKVPFRFTAYGSSWGYWKLTDAGRDALKAV